MDKYKEKQVIYDRLVELTETAAPNEYFSKIELLKYIREAIEEETASFMQYSSRKAKHVEWTLSESGNAYPKETTIDIDEMLPRQKSMRPLLEELVKEGRIEKADIAHMIGYRAKKFSQSL
jgi:hypothetical protein